MNNYFNIACEQVLNIVKKENNRPIPTSIIIKKILSQKNNNIIKSTIYKAIDKLIEDRYLKKINNKIVLDFIDYPEIPNSYFEAELRSITKQKSGFVDYINNDGENASVFIHNRNLNSCLVGDKVLCIMLDNKKDKPEAKIVKLLSRSKSEYSASWINKNIYIDNQKFYLNPILDYNGHIPNNSKITVALKKTLNNNAYFSFKEFIGKIDEAGVDIDAIIIDHDFDLKRNENVCQESKKITYSLNEKDKSIRKDNRHISYVSIDPKTSKDMDDAIYVKKEKDYFLLSVAIADVSYYVQANSILDQDAFNRGTSVYLADRTLGMLHENLSNNICSLNPNVDRFAIVTDIIIDFNGKTINKKVYPAIINNKAQLSYDIVDEYYENPESSSLDNNIKKQLSDSLELYKIIRKQKKSQGYIDLDLKEFELVLNEQGKVTEIKTKVRKDSHKMIEDFMVKTNETVTEIAMENDLPFIFRIHNNPTNEKIVKFCIESKKNKFEIPTSVDWNEVKSSDYVDILEKNIDHFNLELLRKLVLKSMEKAEYSTTNIGHFGLASELYTHFTSPIRRYSDLIVHRILWMFYFNKESYKNEERETLVNNLNSICEQCNKTEIRAVSLERTVFSYKVCEYMEQFVGNVFNAKISAITSFGMFVEIQNGVEGLIPISSIVDDYLVYDEEKMVLISEKTNKIYSLGDELKVKLSAVNRFAGKIDFLLIGRISNGVSDK